MSIPTVDGEVAAGSSKTVDVQPSSAVGLADLECLPTVDADVAAGSSMSVDVQPSSGIGLADLECLYRQ